MKAMVYERYGPPKVLQLKNVAKPVPGDSEVLIKVHAATVVKGDCELRSFRFPLWFWLPLRIYTGLLRPKRVKILGQELAGEIEAVGKDVTLFSKGDQLWAATGIGCAAYAEYACLNEAKVLAIKPFNMSYEEAATIPTGGLNALHYVRNANIQRGEEVLVNGAAGNIGLFVVQLAKHFGARVTAVDSADKLDMLLTLGADKVIDYAKEDFRKDARSYDVLFDVIAESPFLRSLRTLKKNGRYLVINPLLRTMIGGLWASMTSSKKVSFAFADYTSKDLNFLKELIEAGKLKTVIDRIYSLEQTADAHCYVEAGFKKGNVVISLGKSAKEPQKVKQKL